MSIWILAFIVVSAAVLAGWRQGAIRAAFCTAGILIASLLAVPVGKLVHLILPHVGVANPILSWALSPVIGFILVSIGVAVGAQSIHKRVEHFYKYNAGDLRLALWERLNTRVGICLGVLNGVMYFVLVSFVLFNLSYLTSQIAVKAPQPMPVRLANTIGADMVSSGFARSGAAVGRLSDLYYQVADLSGFMIQNPQAASRFVKYPGLTSLWEREDMRSLIQDSQVTNILASPKPINDFFNNPTILSFIQNKDQVKLVASIISTNLTDLKAYLESGKSEKYGGQKLIGEWEFNPNVTVAWMRQTYPKMPSSEMRNIRAWMTQAYAETRLLGTGDNQFFAKKMPKLKSQGPGLPPTTEHNDWKGDWSANGNSYDLHLTFNNEEKFYTATADDLRLTIKDGKNLMIFDRID